MAAPHPSQSPSSPSHSPTDRVARKGPPGFSQRWMFSSSVRCPARGTWMMEWRASTARPSGRNPPRRRACALLSPGGHPAVYDHARADDGGRLVRGEVGGHRGYLLRGDEPAVRLAGLHPGARLLWVVVAGGDARDPGCIDRPRRYAVDPHALFDVVYGRRAGKRQNTALRGAVGGPVRDPDERRYGGDVDHRPPSGLPYGGDGVLHPQEGPLEVHVHHPVPVVLARLKRGPRHADAGVVDHHVEAAPLLEYATHERLDLRSPGDVRLPDQGLALYLAGHPFGRLLVEVGESHPGALAGEPDRDGPPDPGPRARDYGPLAFEPLHRAHPRIRLSPRTPWRPV